MEDEKKDIKYFLKKMKWTEKDLSNYISDPEISHSHYGSEESFGTFCQKYISFKKYI